MSPILISCHVFVLNLVLSALIHNDMTETRLRGDNTYACGFVVLYFRNKNEMTNDARDCYRFYKLHYIKFTYKERK